MFKLETVWPEWHIVEQLGQGSSGSVYMARTRISQVLQWNNYQAVIKEIQHGSAEQERDDAERQRKRHRENDVFKYM